MITKWEEFSKLNEDEGGGGVSSSTLGNTGGMGAIVSAQPSSIPGDVAGSTIGSGDISRTTLGPYSKTPQRNRKKKKKKGENIDQFYVTKYSEKYSDGNIVQNWKANGNT